MAIKYYKTVHADNVRDLDLDVNEHIAGGWQPLGVPYVWTTSDGRTEDADIVCQAVVMDEDTYDGLPADAQAKLRKAMEGTT